MSTRTITTATVATILLNTTPLIVGIGGTTRDGSTSELALNAALLHAASLGCETAAFRGPDLPKDVYDPALPDRSEAARALVDAIRRADGLIISTPSYHGGVSGLIKNALDYIEDLADGERVYLDDRAVGCIVCAYGAQAMGTTLTSMRSIVHALRGWPTPYGATIMARPGVFGGAGQSADSEATEACELVAAQVVRFARLTRASI